MTKKKIIAVLSILIVIAAVIAAGLAISVYNKQRLQTTIQNFGIHETDDVTICNYDDNSGYAIINAYKQRRFILRGDTPFLQERAYVQTDHRRDAVMGR